MFCYKNPRRVGKGGGCILEGEHLKERDSCKNYYLRLPDWLGMGTGKGAPTLRERYSSGKSE